MSNVADANPRSQKIDAVKNTQLSRNCASASPAKHKKNTDAQSRIHTRLRETESTSGAQIPFNTHGRYSELVSSAIVELSIPIDL